MRISRILAAFALKILRNRKLYCSNVGIYSIIYASETGQQNKKTALFVEQLNDG